MKITPELAGLTGAQPGNVDKPRSSTEPQGGSTANAGLDTIHLSALSTELKALGASPDDTDTFDAAKVDALSQAVRDGEYKVDANVVADRMLEAALAKLKPL
jgi:negative regulator of flagellin synthesis FlgM